MTKADEFMQRALERLKPEKKGPSTGSDVADVLRDACAVMDALETAPRAVDPIEDLADIHGGYWDGEHPDFPLEDWHADVLSDCTRQGYWEWVQNRIEMSDGVRSPEDCN